MKKFLLSVILTSVMLPSASTAMPLRFEFDPGEMVLDFTDGSDYGPMYKRDVPFSWEFNSRDHSAPGFTLRNATLDFCNFDRCLQSGGFGSSITATRNGKEIYHVEKKDEELLRMGQGWVRGEFGTVYTQVSLTFDSRGQVSDWSWFIDHDGVAEYTAPGRKAYFESYGSGGDYGYVAQGAGTWSRTGLGGSFLAPVPLPASLPMLGLGLLAIAWRLRSRQTVRKNEGLGGRRCRFLLPGTCGPRLAPQSTRT